MAEQTERNRALISEAFGHWENGDSRPFFALVADDVRWTVIGSTEISGTYDSKRAFVEGATSKLSAGLQGGIDATVRNVLADGDTVVVQWQGQATMTSGRTYDQTYCWVMRLADGKIVESTAYLDTEMVSAVFD